MAVEVSRLRAVLEGWAEENADALRESREQLERFMAPLRAEIEVLPEHEQRSWSDVPLYLLGERSYYRTLLRRDVDRALRPDASFGTRLLQRARGTSRMQRTTRRASRSCTSRDGPSDEPEPPLGGLALDHFRPDLSAAERCAAFLALPEDAQQPYWNDLAERIAEGRL
jgi:hypothetical protein